MGPIFVQCGHGEINFGIAPRSSERLVGGGNQMEWGWLDNLEGQSGAFWADSDTTGSVRGFGL